MDPAYTARRRQEWQVNAATKPPPATSNPTHPETPHALPTQTPSAPHDVDATTFVPSPAEQMRARRLQRFAGPAPTAAAVAPPPSGHATQERRRDTYVALQALICDKLRLHDDTQYLAILRKLRAIVAPLTTATPPMQATHIRDDQLDGLIHGHDAALLFVHHVGFKRQVFEFKRHYVFCGQQAVAVTALQVLDDTLASREKRASSQSAAHKREKEAAQAQRKAVLERLAADRAERRQS